MDWKTTDLVFFIPCLHEERFSPRPGKSSPKPPRVYTKPGLSVKSGRSRSRPGLQGDSLSRPRT